ncbi:MAG: stage III sporulation protein AF [Bacillota bacterium]
MNALTALVRKLVILLLLAEFLHMLAPSDNMKRYTRLVTGLLIILLILQPVLDLFQTLHGESRIEQSLSRDLLRESSPVDETEHRSRIILEEGLKAAEEAKEKYDTGKNKDDFKKNALIDR